MEAYNKIFQDYEKKDYIRQVPNWARCPEGRSATYLGVGQRHLAKDQDSWSNVGS